MHLESIIHNMSKVKELEKVKRELEEELKVARIKGNSQEESILEAAIDKTRGLIKHYETTDL